MRVTSRRPRPRRGGAASIVPASRCRTARRHEAVLCPVNMYSPDKMMNGKPTLHPPISAPSTCFPGRYSPTYRSPDPMRRCMANPSVSTFGAIFGVLVGTRHIRRLAGREVPRLARVPFAGPKIRCLAWVSFAGRELERLAWSLVSGRHVYCLAHVPLSGRKIQCLLSHLLAGYHIRCRFYWTLNVALLSNPTRWSPYSMSCYRLTHSSPNFV